MGEGTHTSEAVYGIGRALGRGPRLWAGCITVTDAETIDTGLDTIEGMASLAVEATDVDAASPIEFVDSVSAGTITFQIADVDAYTDITDGVVYLLVAGAIR